MIFYADFRAVVDDCGATGRFRMFIAWRVPLLAWLEPMTRISAISVRRSRTHGIPSEGTEYGSVILTAPYLLVVTTAIERIYRVPPDVSDRGDISGNGACVYLIGPSARHLKPLNGTDLEKDCSDYTVQEHTSGSESKIYPRPYLLYFCLVATT